MVVAEEKLEESKKLAEAAMWSILENDVCLIFVYFSFTLLQTENISQLCAFVDAQLDFHKRTVDILEQLREQMGVRVQESANRPRQVLMR